MPQPNANTEANSMHTPMANAIRVLAMDAVEKANSGHPGMPMGIADVATVLWSQFLRFDPANPTWPDRDRFILSAGHGSMLLYALGYLTGYKKMTLEEIKKFRQLGSLTPGHPEHDIDIGVETTTGPLGQGIANAVGFALAERNMNARFGNELVDHRTFVIASDGDLMEGISHEAASLAGHLKLGRLIVFYDDNKISIDGPTSLSFTEDVPARFRAYGWHVQNIDGHDPAAIASATQAALDVTDKPSLIACRTIIGYGSPKKQGTSESHGSALGADEVAAAREVLKWEHEAFHLPDQVFSAWRETGKRGNVLAQQWVERLNALMPQSHNEAKDSKGVEFIRVIEGSLPFEFEAQPDNTPFVKLKAKIAAEKPKHATRQSSGLVLEALLPVMPELIGGSADLTPSNNTKVKNFGPVTPENYGGRYIHFGVREHAMAAAMTGMALHGGIIPYGGTFMQFADYCRPSIRLAALMKQRVVFVMTHDSIGLGEDGPTHQPVEHLAALRAIPDLRVFRPCDGIETTESWELALQSKDHPSLLSLTRQGIPTLRGAEAENKTAFGAYVLAEAEGHRQVTLLATGSEVHLAMQAREQLKKDGIAAAVVSMPCFELFEQQSESYRASVLGSVPRVAIEAGVQQGWDKYVGEKGIFIGMTGFGASAPADALFKHFGITAEALIAAAKKLCK